MSASPSRRRRRRNDPTISVSPPPPPPPPQQPSPSPSSTSPSRRRRRNSPTVSVSPPPPQQPPPSPSRSGLRQKEKVAHVSISCHDDLRALQDRSSDGDGRMLLKLVSLESVRIATDSYALLRSLIEQRSCWQCPQIGLLSFVAGVAVELLEIKHDLSSLLEEAVLGEGFPKALILLKNSAIAFQRLGEEAKERLGEDVFLGKIGVVGAVFKSNADEVLVGGTRKFDWFLSCLPPVLKGIDSLLSSQINLSAWIAPVAASSMFLVPSSSPAENFDDGSMEEPEHPEIKVW